MNSINKTLHFASLALLAAIVSSCNKTGASVATDDCSTKAQIVPELDTVTVGRGTLNTYRAAHQAVSLKNGNILFAGGGTGNGNELNITAELYDPLTGKFTSTGSMTEKRSAFTATLLSSGKVLLTGGYKASSEPSANAELYDPATGTFALTGTMANSRAEHQAALLASGDVLITGGIRAGIYSKGSDSELNTAEVYSVATGTFTSVGNMITKRERHFSVLLNDGKVLVGGGERFNESSGQISVAEAELYDPVAHTFSATGAMTAARYLPSATLLDNGKVLIAGGNNADGSGSPSLSSYLKSAELYDPATGAFTLTGTMTVSRNAHAAVKLKNGKVLLTGGADPSCDGAHAVIESYDPAKGTFTLEGKMNDSRFYHTATLLVDGSVLIAGGMPHLVGCGISSEIY